MASLKLADEQRKMRLKADQLNLKVRLQRTRQQLSAVTAQVKSMRKPKRAL